MLVLPGGLWYEGVDLGFNNTAIAAATTVNGLIRPWTARARVTLASIFFEIVSGAAANWDVQVDCFDVNGQTQIVQTQGTFWTAITVDAVLFIGVADNPRATGGAINVNANAPVMGSPYLRFNVRNNDAVNAGNVTLRALLRP